MGTIFAPAYATLTMGYFTSSMKWSVPVHLKSQPHGQNFQAQI